MDHTTIWDFIKYYFNNRPLIHHQHLLLAEFTASIEIISLRSAVKENLQQAAVLPRFVENWWWILA